jgi:hypothetical protein
MRIARLATVEVNPERGSLVRSAFKAVSATTRVAHPEYRVDLDAPLAPVRRPKMRDRRSGRELLRAAAARVYQVGLPVVRPAAFRWRRYTNEPMLAELAALRYELALLSSRASHTAPSSISRRLMDLQRSVARDIPEAAWTTGGRGMPHFAAAVDAVGASDPEVAAVVPLAGFESVARDLMNWVEGVNHPGATVTIVLRFPPADEETDG